MNPYTIALSAALLAGTAASPAHAYITYFQVWTIGVPVEVIEQSLPAGCTLVGDLGKLTTGNGGNLVAAECDDEGETTVETDCWMEYCNDSYGSVDADIACTQVHLPDEQLPTEQAPAGGGAILLGYGTPPNATCAMACETRTTHPDGTVTTTTTETSLGGQMWGPDCLASALGAFNSGSGNGNGGTPGVP
jgi:hypothetical protein